MKDKSVKRNAVIMLGPSLGVRGGISFVVKEYLKTGLDKKIDLTLITTHKDGSKLKKIVVFLRSIPRLIACLLSIKNPIIHIHLSQQGSFFRKLILFLIVKGFHRKVVVQLHGSDFADFMSRNSLNKRLSHYVFNKADHVLVFSGLWKKKLERIAPHQNITVLYNPIATQAPVVRDTASSIVVLFLGILGKRKGIYDLLDCIQENKDSFRRCKLFFVLAGDGDVEKVRQMVRERQVTDMVEVPGWVGEPERERYLRAAAFLILPSYNEQMPMSILEGMSYGLPIISTNIAAIPEMVEHEKNGFLISPGDRKTMAKCIVELALKPDLRKQMGERSREIVAEKFDGKQLAERLAELYRNV